MPTTNKRINITMSDPLYERLLKFKEKQGISSDAGACLQLINMQLTAFEQSEQMMSLLSRFSPEEIMDMSVRSTEVLKSIVDIKKITNGG